MPQQKYDLNTFIKDLRTITSEEILENNILSRIVPLAKSLVLDTSWRSNKHYETDEEQGFGLHLLHEEEDHSLAIFAISWKPGSGVPPHNHKTWSVVVGVEGEEENTEWLRHDDGKTPGHAELKKCAQRVVTRGDVIQMDSQAIHSVTNTGSQTSLSLHIYGLHLNHSGRSIFDPEKQSEEKLLLKVQN